MPIGLRNAPEMFMQMMNYLLMDILHKGVVLFLYNLLIYNTMVEEYLELTREGVCMLV